MHKFMENILNGLINHLQHIGIPVTDLDVSRAFYQRLGFRQVMQSEFPEAGLTGTCVMMQNGSIILELYQLPEVKIREIRDRKDGHIDHITFDVDDIEVAFTALKGASFTIFEEKPVFLPFWEHGCRYFNVEGPDGERLEFNQILKEN